MKASTYQLSQALTFATVQDNLHRFSTFIKKLPSDHFICDLSSVTLCDSAGLALLVEIKRLAQENTKTCSMEGNSSEIKAMAEFCGVRDLLF